MLYQNARSLEYYGDVMCQQQQQQQQTADGTDDSGGGVAGRLLASLMQLSPAGTMRAMMQALAARGVRQEGRQAKEGGGEQAGTPRPGAGAGASSRHSAWGRGLLHARAIMQPQLDGSTRHCKTQTRKTLQAETRKP